MFVFFKQKTAYGRRIRDWSSVVGSSALNHSAIAMAVAIVAEMANSATRKGVSTSEWNLIKSAVQWTIDGGYADEGIDWVRAWLGAYPQFAAADLDRVEHLKPVARELAFNLREDRKSTRLNSSH